MPGGIWSWGRRRYRKSWYFRNICFVALLVAGTLLVYKVLAPLICR